MRFHIRRVLSGLAFILGGAWLLLSMMPDQQDIKLKVQPRNVPRQADDDFPLIKDVQFEDKVDPQQNDAAPPIGHKHQTIDKESFVDNNYYSTVIFPPHANRQENQFQIWPDPKRKYEDRIVKQMQYVPKTALKKDPSLESNFKTIFLPGGISSGTPRGRQKFQDDKCDVDMCWITDNSKWRQKADVVLFQNEYYYEHLNKAPHQLYILWLLESPFHSGTLSSLNGLLNWTATYRSDSTIVTPYEKFVHFSNFTGLPTKPVKNYAAGKTKLVAWFVSNCAARNKRWEYVQALKIYGIDVHIYGACGPYQCDRFIDGKCDDMLSADYKFYLSFENSNCDGYITEKFYQNALRNDIVPIVMGARKETYSALAPPDSYIHVEDYDSPKELAELLLKLDADDEQYNHYLRWKHTGEFINTKFWCRLCAMVHDDSGVRQWYTDVESWWRGQRTCTFDRWDVHENYVQDWDHALGGMY